MKRITLIILAVMALLAGSVSCQKDNITPESPMPSVSMSIIPDFSDGSVYSYSDDGSFFLRISVSPEEFLANIENNDGFICKADFRCMITKAIPEYPDFTVAGKITSSFVEEGYMTTYFELTKDEIAKLQEADYMVSFSIKAGDGTFGAITSYVPMSYQRVGQGGEIEMPEGALPGLFTVAPNGKQVYFSQGNLWYGKLTEDATEATWNLEENQYGVGLGEMIDDSQKNIMPNYYWLEDHVSHFYWTEIPSEAYVQGSNNDAFDETLFTNLVYHTQQKPNPEFIANGQKGIWRVLSLTKDGGEWDYLLYKRTMTYGKPRYTDKLCAKFDDGRENILVAGESVLIEGNEYSGLFIYPDDYNGNEIGTEGAPDTWREINATGIVFLPAAGDRKACFEGPGYQRHLGRGSSRTDPPSIIRIKTGKEIRDVGRRCDYWANRSELTVYYFDYQKFPGRDSRLFHHEIRDRYINCCAIRLVTDAN